MYIGLRDADTYGCWIFFKNHRVAGYWCTLIYDVRVYRAWILRSDHYISRFTVKVERRCRKSVDVGIAGLEGSRCNRDQLTESG